MIKNKKFLLESPKNVLDYLKFLQYDNNEQLYLITVNAGLEIIDCHHLKSGCTNIDLIHPRDIILPALTDKAKGIILVHNHPSGKSSPSDTDRIFTKYIKKICELLNIGLVDHLIIGKDEIYSFKESGTGIFPCARYSSKLTSLPLLPNR